MKTKTLTNIRNFAYSHFAMANSEQSQMRIRNVSVGLQRRTRTDITDMDNGKKFVFDIALLETHHGNYVHLMLAIARSSLSSICDLADRYLERRGNKD